MTRGKKDEEEEDDGVADFGAASTLERTVLMCMERIAELERRADDAERMCRAQDARHRATLVRGVMCVGSNSIQIFIDVMAWLIGVTPTMARLSKELKIAVNEIEGLEVTARALELHAIGRRGVVDGKYVWTELSPVFRPITSILAEDELDVAAMLDAMTTDELERYWAWRIAYTGWGGNLFSSPNLFSSLEEPGLQAATRPGVSGAPAK